MFLPQDLNITLPHQPRKFLAKDPTKGKLDLGKWTATIL
jgi:hypothetical protein